MKCSTLAYGSRFSEVVAYQPGVKNRMAGVFREPEPGCNHYSIPS